MSDATSISPWIKRIYVTFTRLLLKQKTSTRLLAKNLQHDFLILEHSSPLDVFSGHACLTMDQCFPLYTVAPTGPKTKRGRRCILHQHQPKAMVSTLWYRTPKEFDVVGVLIWTQHKCQTPSLQCQQVRLIPFAKNNHTCVSCHHLKTQCRSVLSSSPSQHP
jgi:hypothetical protein